MSTLAVPFREPTLSIKRVYRTLGSLTAWKLTSSTMDCSTLDVPRQDIEESLSNERTEANLVADYTSDCFLFLSPASLHVVGRTSCLVVF